MPVTHSMPMARNHRPQGPAESGESRPSPGTVLDRLAAGAGRAARITHTEHLPPRAGRHAVWPDRIRAEVIDAIQRAGIDHPWAHQATAAEHALDGESVVIATGTASGKSLAYLAPVLSTLLDGSEAPNGRGATALYLAPTKALAADQRRSVKELAAPLGTRVRPAVYDGDTPVEEREWVRQYANYVLTNPDMLHRGILPSHPRWASFLRSLRYVVIDECHTYRGVFGSHVAQVLQPAPPRLRPLRGGPRLPPGLRHRGAARPGRPWLTGLPVHEVADDASPRGELVFALWEPPLTDLHGEKGAPVRRTATAETAEAPHRPHPPGRPYGRVRTVPARRREPSPSSPRNGWRRSTAPWSAGSPPTGAATCPRNAAPWRGPCTPANSSASRPPPPWNSVSTCPAWRPS